jgi:hypothetical protein
MTQQKSTVSWSDVVWSTAILASGWALVFSPSWLDRLSTNSDRGELLVTVAGGLAIGAAQWLVTTRRFGADAWWVVAYGLGWWAGMWCGFRYGLFSPNPFIMGASGGAIVGVMQWVTLRHHVPRAMWWVPASVLLSVLGCWSGVATGMYVYNHMSSQATAYLVGSSVGGAVIGLLTGLTLRWFTNAVRE